MVSPPPGSFAPYMLQFDRILVVILSTKWRCFASSEEIEYGSRSVSISLHELF